MGYFHEFDPVNHISRVRFEGELTDALVRKCYEDAKRLAALKLRGAILDLSAVTSVQVESATMHELASRPPLFNDPMPRFIVAPSDVTFGLARMFQLQGDKTRQALQVVRTSAEAYSRLGITAEHFMPMELSGTNPPKMA